MSLALSWRRSLSYTFSRCLENSENECNIKNITTYGTERLKTYFNFSRFIQKQPSTGAFIKKCPENMQQIYRRTPMPKGDFQKVALQIYWNHTSAWMFSCNLLHIFRTPLEGSFWVYKKFVLKHLTVFIEEESVYHRHWLQKKSIHSNVIIKTIKWYQECNEEQWSHR